MWAYIKKALNSSLGTGEFQPLDKIILSQRSLVASDNPFMVLLSSSISTNLSSNQLAASFVPNTNGSVRLIITAKAISPNGRVDVDVYEDDTRLQSDKVVGITADVIFDVKVVKGHTYKVMYRSYDNSTVHIKNIKINANIVDNTLISVEV